MVNQQTRWQQMMTALRSIIGLEDSVSLPNLLALIETESQFIRENKADFLRSFCDDCDDVLLINCLSFSLYSLSFSITTKQAPPDQWDRVDDFYTIDSKSIAMDEYKQWKAGIQQLQEATV